MKKTYGKGFCIVRFIFKDEDEIHEITFRVDGRAGVAKCLRQFHRAKQYVREHGKGNYPNFGYRYIAQRNPKCLVFCIKKDSLRPHIKSYEFHYCFAGKMTPTRKIIASVKYGYREW